MAKVNDLWSALKQTAGITMMKPMNLMSTRLLIDTMLGHKEPKLFMVPHLLASFCLLSK
jgi:hypothetical protein